MLFLIRILLIWWLLTIVMRFISGSRKKEAPSTGAGSADTADDTLSDIPIAGDIEDADFEEIDSR